jgi:hypothetical protein
VIAVRVFSMSTALLASTDTAGSAEPDGSRTVPRIAACAKADARGTAQEGQPDEHAHQMANRIPPLAWILSARLDESTFEFEIER